MMQFLFPVLDEQTALDVQIFQLVHYHKSLVWMISSLRHLPLRPQLTENYFFSHLAISDCRKTDRQTDGRRTDRFGAVYAALGNGGRAACSCRANHTLTTACGRLLSTTNAARPVVDSHTATRRPSVRPLDGDRSGLPRTTSPPEPLVVTERPLRGT